MQPRTKAVLITLLVFLVLAAASVSVPAVRAAIRRWFGYVPGFGLVQDEGIRVLAAPVSVTQEGFTLTVSEATLSSTKTVVRYRLEGLAANMLVEMDACPLEQVHPIMRLPGGTELELQGYGVDHSTDPGAPAYYGGEAAFSAVPPEVTEAVLVIGCLMQVDPEAVPGNWEVPLHFVAAPPEMTVAPVLDATPVTGQSMSGQGLVLNKVIPTQDGYILAGTIRVSPPEAYTVDEWDGFLEDVTITDATGQELVYSPAPDDFLPEELSTPQPEGTFGWAAQIGASGASWPLTMTVHSVSAVSTPYPPAEFRFDAGPDPQVDQVWMLNQDLPVGPKTVRVVSVQRIQREYGFDGYEFTFEYDPTVDLSLEIEGHLAMGGGGSGPSPDGTYSRALSYPDGIPSGTLTVIVNAWGVIQLPGPWQVTWEAPAGELEPSATP